MTKKFENFREKEMSDGTYLVADPVQPNEEQLRIDVGWFDIEPGEKGQWEEIVGTIVKNDLREELQLQEDGEGTIERMQAIDNILDADPEGSQPIMSRDQAAAIIDYFIEEGALTERANGEIVVLHDPTTLSDEDTVIDGDPKYQILSWAAAIDACIDYMDETLESFESARDRLDNRLDDVEESEVSDAERKALQKGQELKNLGPGSDVPNPDELSPEQRKRYETLKEDYAYYKKLYEVEKEKLGTAEQGIEKLGRNIDRLEAARDTYQSKVKDIRSWALEKEIFPENAIDIADNMAETITALSGMESHKDYADSLDSDDLTEDINSMLGESEAMLETIDDSVDVEVTPEDSQDIQIE